MIRLALPLSSGILGALFLSGAASAGALSVSPMRIELSARHPVATLEVTNEGADPITVQLERMAWSQAAGEDSYSASAALIATPSVFELAPHEHQVLRLALRNPAVGGAERAFRLYAAEVPVAQRFASTGLQMALRVGVPVFACSGEGEARLDGEIATGADGRLTVLLRNSGTHFARAVSLELQDAVGHSLWNGRAPAYVLAGGEHRWPLDLSASALPADMPLRLSVQTEHGVQIVDARRSP